GRAVGEEGALQVEVEREAPPLVGAIVKGAVAVAAATAAGDMEKHVEAAQDLDRAGDELFGLLGNRHVGGDERDPPLRITGQPHPVEDGDAFGARFRQPGEDQRGTFVEEPLGGGQSDSGRPPDDQAALAGEQLGHAHPPWRAYNGATRRAYWA